jgi:prepilin-type N-terminal cleavage/methylation domain-containing protein
MAGSRPPSLSPCRSEDGFTIIEVMVATVILLVGLMGVLGIVIQADGVSTSNRAREQGVALQREIIEDARAIPYDQLSQSTIVGKLQGQPGLSDSTSGSSGWTVQRRNITYTVAVGTCAVDDSSDGTGPHESAGYCVNGTGSTTAAQCLQFLGRKGSIAGTGTPAPDCGIDTNLDGAVDGLADNSGAPCTNCAGADKNPNDYKRVVVLVRWNRGLGTRYALQSATIANPGLSAAPAVSSLSPVSMQVGPNTTSAPFTATTSFPPATVEWYVDGTAQNPPASGSLTSWTITWPLGSVDPSLTKPSPGEVLDGTYLVSAKAFDAYGQSGSAKASTVVINRRWPYPPSNLQAGANDGDAYLEWTANAERDVEGYRVFRVNPSGSDKDVCGFLTSQTRCMDHGIPAGDQQYYVLAYDRDSSGVQRPGDKSPRVTVPGSDAAPFPPVSLRAARSSATSTVLSWTAASPADPDAGDSIRYYRIYRDGTDWVTNYYGRTATGANLSFTDTATNGETHVYWVVAVDQSNKESRPLGTGVGPV